MVKFVEMKLHLMNCQIDIRFFIHLEELFILLGFLRDKLEKYF